MIGNLQASSPSSAASSSSSSSNAGFADSRGSHNSQNVDQVPSHESRRRFRDGGAVLVASRRRQFGSGSSATGVSNNGAPSATVVQPRQVTHRRGPNVGRSSRTQGQAPEEMGGGSEEVEDSMREGRGHVRSLLMEVHQMQRQLESLQRATVSMQEAVERTRRVEGILGASPTHSPHDRHTTGNTVDTAGITVPMGTRHQTGRRSGEAGSVHVPVDVRRSASMQYFEELRMEQELHAEDVHQGVTCDGCGAGAPLLGQVMKCLDCENFDLCMSCYRIWDRHRRGHPAGHTFDVRIPGDSMGGLAGLLARIQEEEMILMALQLSDEAENGDDASASVEDDPEIRAAEVLSKLQRIPWAQACNEGCDEVECPMCLEEYVSGEEVLSLPCKHVFHEACLSPWLIKSLQCPMCKQDLY